MCEGVAEYHPGTEHLTTPWGFPILLCFWRSSFRSYFEITMLYNKRSRNYSAGPEQKNMLGILRGWGRFLPMHKLGTSKAQTFQRFKISNIQTLAPSNFQTLKKFQTSCFASQTCNVWKFQSLKSVYMGKFESLKRLQSLKVWGRTLPLQKLLSRLSITQWI